MNLTLLHTGAFSSSRDTRTLPVSAKIKEPEAVNRRRLALRRLDRELSKGNHKRALTLVKQLQGKPGGLRGFGAAKQVPRRISSLDQLKLGGIDTSSPQYLVDSILDSIKRSTEFQLTEEVSESELEHLTHEFASEDHLTWTQGLGNATSLVIGDLDFRIWKGIESKAHMRLVIFWLATCLALYQKDILCLTWKL